MAEKTGKSKKLNGKPVLVIGSPKGIRARLLSSLGKAGIAFVAAAPADKDFRQKITDEWDAILISGVHFNLINRIRQKRGLRQLPMLVFHAKGKAPAAGPLSGADDYLQLPMDAAGLTTRINAAVERGRRQINAYTLKQGAGAIKQILATVRSGSNDSEVLQFAAGQLARMYPSSRCTILVIDQAQEPRLGGCGDPERK